MTRSIDELVTALRSAAANARTLDLECSRARVELEAVLEAKRLVDRRVYDLRKELNAAIEEGITV